MRKTRQNRNPKQTKNYARTLGYVTLIEKKTMPQIPWREIREKQ